MIKEMFTYGMNDESIIKLRNIASQNKVALVKVIDDSMINMKIKDIISKETKSSSSNEHILINEKVILLNNFNNTELNNIIKDIRKHEDLSCILAVVTPTSKEWEFEYLVQHLIEEREWHKNNKK